ncbi:TPA: MGMT family protein [Photobacterium damselae]
MDDFSAHIYGQVYHIPKGKISTYGDIARFAGYPGYARQVGKLLANLPEGSTIPWHRVINSQGQISLKGENLERQKRHLEQEGIEVSVTGRIRLKNYRWNGE